MDFVGGTVHGDSYFIGVVQNAQLVLSCGAGGREMDVELQVGGIGGISCLIRDEASGCPRCRPPCVPFLGFL
jgi:hypothetical protein